MTIQQTLTKEAWIQALRDGEYRQNNGCLRSKNDEFCCLGVACNVYDPSGWRMVNVSSLQQRYYYDTHNADGSVETSHSHLPTAIQKALKLRTASGAFSAPDEWLETLSPEDRQLFEDLLPAWGTVRYGYLVSLNDNRVPFKTIARIIELEPPGLFEEEYEC